LQTPTRHIALGVRRAEDCDINKYVISECYVLLSQNEACSLSIRIAKRHGAALWIVCGFAAQAWSAGSSATGTMQSTLSSTRTTAGTTDFDIAAQPLAQALDQYAVMSHQSVVFPDDLVSGRISAPVLGRFTPQVALHILLTGTGLLVNDVDENRDRTDAFVLQLARPSAAPTHAGADRQYDALVQSRVWEALCANPRTAPGDYRTVLRFHVDGTGRLQQASLLASTGSRQRDTAMLAILQALRIGQPPPDHLAQPIMLLILPRSAIADHRDCQEGQ
jgi:hypothetical protein